MEERPDGEQHATHEADPANAVVEAHESELGSSVQLLRGLWDLGRNDLRP
jgi:hypothetical protein